MQSLHSKKSRDKRTETHTSFDMSRKSKAKDPESLKMERTEKRPYLCLKTEPELRTMDNKVTGED